jgi:hypothetical protein
VLGSGNGPTDTSGGGNGLGDPAAPGPTTTSVAPLARTGYNSVPFAVMGGVLTYLGIVVALLARRRRHAWA